MLRRAWIALVAGALALSIGARAGCQTLHLDPLPPAPTLPEPNAAARLAQLLQEELHTIEILEAETPAAKNANQARVALRRMAYELLVRGARAEEYPTTGHTLAMEGFRIADARRRVDLNLATYLDGSIRVGSPPRPLGVRERDRVDRLLKSFAEIAPSALAHADLKDLAQVDGALATAIGPLCDALAVLEGRTTGAALGGGWPTPDELAAVGGAASPGGASPDEAVVDFDPCASEVQAALPDAVRAAVAAACAGEARPADEIRTAVRLARAATDAAWLQPEERAQLVTSAAAIARREGSAVLAAAQADLVENANGLAQRSKVAPYDEKGLAATLRSALFPAADSPFVGSPDRLARQTTRMAESLGLAIRYRDDLAAAKAPAAGPAKDLPKDLRPMRKDFERAYLRAEETTFRSLGRLVSDPDATTSPELVGLVRGQRDALDDLGRLASTQGLLDRIGGVRPQAVRGVTVRVRTMLRWLLEPARRADGLAAWGSFTTQVEHFVPLPFEEELRRETPEAIELSAGEARKLVETIDIARADWADAWADGDGNGPAAQTVNRLWRLCRVMRSLASEGAGPGNREQVPILSRWGGFHSTRAAFAPALTDVTALTKLAVHAALAGDAATLDRELDRIERDAPLSQLAGRLVTDLGPWLAKRPEGVLGSLTAMREVPSERAWGLRLRLRLAGIARFARELEDARRMGNDKLEQPILDYLRRLAESSLSELGSERSPIMPLPQLFEQGPVDNRKRRR